MLLSSKENVSQNRLIPCTQGTHLPPPSIQYLNMPGIRAGIYNIFPLEIQNLYTLERNNHWVTILYSALSRKHTRTQTIYQI